MHYCFQFENIGMLAFIFRLSYLFCSLASEDGFFGAVVKNFVQCTITGIEMNPRSVVRNVSIIRVFKEIKIQSF